MPGQIPQEFFTLQSMLTLTGASGATFVICNGLQRALDFNPRWLGLVIAEAISIYGTYATTQQLHASHIVVAIVNGFLIFATAAGVTNMGGREPVPPKTRGQQDSGKPPRRFWTPWFGRR